MTSNKKIAGGLLSLICFLVASRVIPHPPNFTPVLAVAIFAPYFARELVVAVAIPLVAMVLSDLIIGLHSSMIWVYGAVAASVVISHYLRKTGSLIVRIGSLAFVSPLLFFIVTNFGVWLGSGFYAHTIDGLTACYIAALPFFGNTLVSTIAFSGLFYGLMRLTGQQHRMLHI
tara:strand:+ start:212 stop:730 length:519 start_codon:yes stop_codon:yes gene_type:complete